MEECIVKKAYRAPVAKKIDYAYQEQVVAESYPLHNYADPWRGSVCTWGDGSCSVIYNLMARGLNDCQVQGNPDLINPY